MKRFFKIILISVLALSLYSIAPAALIYLKKHVRQPTNAETVELLKKNQGNLFGFIVFGDNHAGFIFCDSAFLKLARNMSRENRYTKLPIDFAMSVGDVTFSKGLESDYRTYDKLRSTIKWPVMSAMGNHDHKDGGWRLFRSYVGVTEFSFTDRNSYFIVLDNKISDLSERQFLWLEEELIKASVYKHRFIFMHKTPISSYQQSWFRPELSKWSYNVMKLFEKYKVDMVFAGHEHMFRENVFGGVKYITTGGAGMLTQIPDADGGYLHYVVVRVYGDYVDYEVRRITPPFWEFVTYYMWKEIFYYLKGVFLREGILF